MLGGDATAAQFYANRVLATNPLRFNKLNESSGTAIIDSSANAYTGTYTGVDLANTASPFAGDNAPLWGTDDYGNIYSTSFATAFNPNEFTVLLWIKVSAVGVWTDATTRFLFNLRLDLNNRILVTRTVTNNQIAYRRIGNAVDKIISVSTFTETGWISMALSCSIAGGGLLSAGDTRAYKNGAQAGATATGSAAFVGSGLSSTETLIGAQSTSVPSPWSGWLAYFAIWNRPMANDILALMS